MSRERLESMVKTMEMVANPGVMRAVTAHEQGKMKFTPRSALDG